VALIVFHPGMAKAGSTSLQTWLAENLSMLRGRGIECMRVVQRRATDPITLEPCTPAKVASKPVDMLKVADLAFLARHRAKRPAVAQQICEALDAQAARADVLVVSSESYSVFFDSFGRRKVLRHLDALARTHTVRVAYYVRPQHSWLESAWLQWGFRHPAPPDAWIRKQRPRIDYLKTLHVVREAAPHLSFEMRPVRADLLEGGDVVSDFGQVFLGLRDVPLGVTPPAWSNRSLPLEAAVLLRDAPTGLFWSSIHDNRRFYPLKELILQWELPSTEIATRSRELLHRYAYATFEPGNQQLIRELGWNAECFVPPVDGAGSGTDAELAELNVLWRSTAGDVERQIFFSALQQSLSAQASSIREQPARDSAESVQGRGATHRLRAWARGVLVASRDRARGARTRLTIAPSKRVTDGRLLRLRFHNNGPPGTFEASAHVHEVGSSAGPTQLHLPWGGERLKRTASVERGGTQLLRLAIARSAVSTPEFALLAIDESSGFEERHVVRNPVEVSIAIRRCDSDRIVVEQSVWVDYTRADGQSIPTVRFSRPQRSGREPAERQSTREMSVSTDIPSSPASLGSPSRRSSHRSEDQRVIDLAADVGLELQTRTYGAVVFDYNSDGWPDIFLGRHGAPAFLYRNDRGHFVRDRSVQFPGHTDRHCSAAGDVNGDGRLDLFCVVGGASGHEPKRFSNELWIQQPDGSFVNEGDQTGLADPYGRGREAVMFDANGDGCLDILVGNVSPRSDGKPSPNRLFLNDGNGRFQPAPEFGLDLEYSVGGAGKPGSRHGGGNWPMGRLTTLDANNNGWTDVLMCAKSKQDTVQSIHLFHNDEGKGFRDITADAGLAGIEARDAVVADMTGDGQPDLVIVNERSLTICINDQGAFRVGYQMPVDHAFRVRVADASGDGHPDMYVMRTNRVPAPDLPDLLLISRGTYGDYKTITLPTVDGVVRDDDVYPIDFDRDGRWEFLVLHGHSRHAAPIQLIALR
jgi:hypothetical protein